MFRHAVATALASLKQLFFLIPDLVALLLTAIGIAVIFMNELLKSLEERPRWRLAIIASCISFGILAVVSNQVQKAEDNRTAAIIRTQTALDREILTGQITTLISGSQSQATSADVKGLATGISVGFQHLEAAIAGKGSGRKPAGAPAPQDTVPPSTGAARAIHFTQKRVASTNPDAPFALQVIIQSDTSISPVGLVLAFSGPILDIKFFIAGQSNMFMSQSFVSDKSPNLGYIRVGSPALGPDSPFVVTVHSRLDVSLVSVEQNSAPVASGYR